jgi:hypothetical protein
MQVSEFEHTARYTTDRSCFLFPSYLSSFSFRRPNSPSELNANYVLVITNTFFLEPSVTLEHPSTKVLKPRWKMAPVIIFRAWCSNTIKQPSYSCQGTNLHYPVSCHNILTQILRILQIFWWEWHKHLFKYVNYFEIYCQYFCVLN